MSTEAVTAGVGTFDRVRGPLVVAAGVGLAGAALLLHDPHGTGSWGFCPLYLITGLYCPLCGGLRATSDLLHGDLVGAWGMNPLWVLLAVPAGLAWVDWLVRRWRARSARALPVALGWTVLALALAFGVARNLPSLVLVLGPH